MADDLTARWGLPLLVPGQAQKEMTHNEALAALDVIAQPAVVAAGIDTPPETPEEGACWIVGAAPELAWAGHAGEIAGWTAGGWRFVSPQCGTTVWLCDRNVAARFGDVGWISGEIAGDSLVLGGQTMLAVPAAAIATPTGGGTIDSEARASIGAIIELLRGHNLMLAP